MPAVKFVPEEFRDKQHLLFVQRRLTVTQIVIAAAFLAVTAICIANAHFDSGALVKIGIPAAAGLTAIAQFSLYGTKRKLSVVDQETIITFIEACDQDETGRASAAVSPFISELYGNQGFLTLSQFDMIRSALHGIDVEDSSALNHA
jgi:hypothetical protein